MLRIAMTVLTSLSLGLANASAGTIDFYEGNNGTQNIKGTLQDTPGQSHNLTKKDPPVQNDEARSLKLNGVKAGTVITVYDDPEGRDGNDDRCVIEVLKDVHEYTVGTFEKTYTNDTVKVNYSKNNGLDGKVSHIKVAHK